jgi:hypothetical protein
MAWIEASPQPGEGELVPLADDRRSGVEQQRGRDADAWLPAARRHPRL